MVPHRSQLLVDEALILGPESPIRAELVYESVRLHLICSSGEILFVSEDKKFSNVYSAFLKLAYRFTASFPSRWVITIGLEDLQCLFKALKRLVLMPSSPAHLL
jgi:hypothetical protein